MARRESPALVSERGQQCLPRLGRYREGVPAVALVDGGEYRGPGLGGSQYEPPSTEVRHSTGRFGECLGLVGTKPNPAIPTERLEDRMSLAAEPGSGPSTAGIGQAPRFAGRLPAQAAELISSGRVRDAFDLTRRTGVGPSRSLGGSAPAAGPAAGGNRRPAGPGRHRRQAAVPALFAAKRDVQLGRPQRQLGHRGSDENAAALVRSPGGDADRGHSRAPAWTRR